MSTSHKKKTFNIADRAQDTKRAIYNSDPNETVLIAGKGHEEQQI